MNTVKAIEAIASILTTDTQYLAACNMLFAKAPKVFIGTNTQDPISKESMPAVVIDGVVSRLVDGCKSSFRILLGFLNASEIETTVGNIITLKGFIDNETFKEETCRAIIRHQQKLKAKISFSDGETFTNLVFPVFSCKIIVNFEYTIPGNRIEDYF
jgi:hypothetical protein